MTFFSYSVTVFQLLLELELLAINKLQLQLELTDAYFSVITRFQLQLLLTGITLDVGKEALPSPILTLLLLLLLHVLPLHIR